MCYAKQNKLIPFLCNISLIKKINPFPSLVLNLLDVSSCLIIFQIISNLTDLKDNIAVHLYIKQWLKYVIHPTKSVYLCFNCLMNIFSNLNMFV